MLVVYKMGVLGYLAPGIILVLGVLGHFGFKKSDKKNIYHSKKKWNILV